jgi:two-component sensor histidine kinase/PAS domain-containing protein
MNSRLAGRRILVVEDEALVAWAIEDMLVELGCIVVGPAARVSQALVIVEGQPLDAAVLDVNLNGEKCYPVAEALTARGVPFIFSTAYNKDSLQKNYLGSPMLQKPLELSTFSNALEELFTPGIHSTLGKNASPGVWDANRLRIATDAAGVALWSWNVDTDQIDMDERAHRLWGVPLGVVTFEDLSANIHPEDRDRVRATFAATREILGAYEVDFRIAQGVEIRWISARGRGDDQGIVGRLMFGVFLDVTERKMAEEAREMLAGEMGHRVKNLFSLAAALTTMSARSTATSAEMAQDLIRRLTALNLAHDLVRPILSEPRHAVLLGELLAVLLAPYDEEGAVGVRVRVSVPELLVGEASSTTLALVIHELATNSIKYGALSKATGILDVAGISDGGDFVLTWTERGGPPVAAPTKRPGFGSNLVTRAISGQLGGAISFDWASEGVIVTLRMSKATLGA